MLELLAFLGPSWCMVHFHGVQDSGENRWVEKAVKRLPPTLPSSLSHVIFSLFHHVPTFSFISLIFQIFSLWPFSLFPCFSPMSPFSLFSPSFQSFPPFFWSKRRVTWWLPCQFCSGRSTSHTQDTETSAARCERELVSYWACFCAFSVARRVHTSTWPLRVLFSRKVTERKILKIRLIGTLAFSQEQWWFTNDGNQEFSLIRTPPTRGSHTGENSFKQPYYVLFVSEVFNETWLSWAQVAVQSDFTSSPEVGRPLTIQNVKTPSPHSPPLLSPLLLSLPFRLSTLFLNPKPWIPREKRR